MLARLATRLALLTLLGSSAAALAAPPSSFAEQVEAHAKRLSLKVDWVIDTQLEPDPETEKLARLCAPGSLNDSLFVLEQNPGVLWTVEGVSDSCPSEAPAAEPLPTTLELGVYEPRVTSIRKVAFREGRPVLVLSSENSTSPEPDGDYEEVEEDWDALTLRRTTKDSAFLAGLIPVLASREAAARLPPTSNQVTFGRGRWAGEDDASLQVVALAQEAGLTRLRVEVRDDVRVPATQQMGGRALLGTDHLELWWSDSNASGGETRQLAVALAEDGAAFARWLHPEGNTEPLPPVAMDGDTYVVDLPLSNPEPATTRRAALTVVYSDSDDAAAGQQTLVATSSFERDAAETFGQLVFFPGHSRYPPDNDASWGGQPPRRLDVDEGPADRETPPAQGADAAAPSEAPWLSPLSVSALLGLLFVGGVALSRRHRVSRVLLVIQSVLAALLAAVVFAESTQVGGHGAVGSLFVIPAFLLSVPVFTTVAVMLTRRLSREPGARRVWVAAWLAAVAVFVVFTAS